VESEAIFEVFTTVFIKMSVFYDMKPWGRVHKWQGFEAAYCLHFHSS